MKNSSIRPQSGTAFGGKLLLSFLSVSIIALLLSAGGPGCSGVYLNGPTLNDTGSLSYAVGVTTRTWVDTSRPTPQNGHNPGKPARRLVTEIWYPSAGLGASKSPARDVPVAPGGPYPLVLFVHGSSGTRTAYTYLTTGLARAGYVVAAADFPLTCMFTRGGVSDANVSAQVGDLSFLCDQLKAAARDPDDKLQGAVDGLHYAVVGHSTGGAVAELAAFAGDDAAIKHDPRVSAVVPLAGNACMFSPQFFKRRTVPIFAIGATNDLFVPFAINAQWVFDNTDPPHFLAKLVGGTHIYFTDYRIPDSFGFPAPMDSAAVLATTLSAYGDASECRPLPPARRDPGMSFATQHALVVQLVTAFLDAEMRQRPATLLAALAADNPLVIFQQ